MTAKVQCCSESGVAGHIPVAVASKIKGRFHNPTTICLWEARVLLRGHRFFRASQVRATGAEELPLHAGEEDADNLYEARDTVLASLAVLRPRVPRSQSLL